MEEKTGNFPVVGREKTLTLVTPLISRGKKVRDAGFRTSAIICVTEEQITAFQQDGVICLRQLLSSEEIESLRDGFEANLKSPSGRRKGC
jgi:hypothetical protein